MQMPPIVSSNLLHKSPGLQDDSDGETCAARLPKRIPFIHSHLATPAVVAEETTLEAQSSGGAVSRPHTPPNAVQTSTLRPEPYATAEKLSRRGSIDPASFSFPPRERDEPRTDAGTGDAAPRRRPRGRGGDESLLKRTGRAAGASEELGSPPAAAAEPPAAADHSEALQRLGSSDTLFQIVEEEEDPDTQSITLAYMPTQPRPAAAHHALKPGDVKPVPEYLSVRAHARAQRYTLRTSRRSAAGPKTEPMLRAARAPRGDGGPRSARTGRVAAAPQTLPPQIVAAEPARASVMRAAGGTPDCMPRRQPPPPDSALQTRMDYLHYQLDISETSEILEGLMLQTHPHSRTQGGAHP